jgi:hypothetical protein
MMIIRRFSVCKLLLPVARGRRIRWKWKRSRKSKRDATAKTQKVNGNKTITTITTTSATTRNNSNFNQQLPIKFISQKKYDRKKITKYVYDDFIMILFSVYYNIRSFIDDI